LKSRFILVYIIVFLIYFFNPADSFSLVYIDINAPVLKKFPIAITKLVNLGDSENALEDDKITNKTLIDDLKSTGIFDILDYVMFLEYPDASGIKLETIDFDDWTIIDAEGLVKGGYRIKENDVLEVEMRLFDTYQEQLIIGKKYIGTIDDMKRIMHRFANEILLKFTGERGIFGSKISYVSDVEYYKEIFIIDIDGSNNVQITRDFSIDLSPAWSPDGMKLSYTSYKHGNPDLVINDFVKREVRTLSKRKGLNLGGEWSYDGEMLALAMNDGNNSEVYIMDAEVGTVIKKLTDYWGIDVSPTWSPDGKQIAFTSDRAGNPNIYVANVRNRRAKRITFNGKYNSSPSWSPRGDKIAFCGMTSDGMFNIFTINPDGTDLTQLTSKSKNNEGPSWSPDGRQIVFASNRKGNYDVYIMNASGANIRRLTYTKGDATAPSWSPRIE
jgi:TolB protein